MKLAVSFFILTCMALSSSASASDAVVGNFKFGILRLMPNGEYIVQKETKIIPRKLKDSGFRWGVQFDNPKREMVEWYEVVHLPAPLRSVSGDLKSMPPVKVVGEVYKSDDSYLVDQFWFDEGDPLGPHKMDLYVNGTLRFSVNFEVVDPKAVEAGAGP